MSGRGATEWWQRRGYMLLLLVLLAVPLLWPPIPPLIDVPGHIGRYHVAAQIDRSPLLQRYYSYEWKLFGNLGVDLLVYPLQRLIGVEAAAKLVVLLIPPLIGAGLLLCAREAHGRLPATAPIALIFGYAHPFLYGFVNYSLSIGLAFIAFALWLRLGLRGAARTRFLVFLPLALLVWIAHAVGWAILCVLCGASLLYLSLRRERSVPVALLRTALGCLPLLTPVIPSLLQVGAASPGQTYGWFDPGQIAKWAVAVTRDRWLWFDLACASVVAGTIALAATRRFGLRIEPLLGWPALALAALYVVMPQAVGGSVYISSRILPFAAATALIAVRTDAMAPARQRLAAALAAGFLAVRLAATAVGLALVSAAYSANLRAIDYIPRGARLATFSLLPCAQGLANWNPGRGYHLGGIAIARRDAFSNNFWELDATQLLNVRYMAPGEFRHDPSETVTAGPCPGGTFRDLGWSLANLPRGAFDYVWLIDVPPALRPRDSGLRPVYANEATALYAIAR